MLTVILSGGSTMRSGHVILAEAIVMAPLGAQSADLVVWWEEGYHAQVDAKKPRSSTPR
jgi:hypothetical protein